jgi:HAD superfamily hydrolase (TIGR01457 family)
MDKSVSPHLQALILDMDGVLWRDDDPIGNLPEIFNRIKQRGLQVTLATNNATKTIEQYLQKLNGFGVILQPAQIVNSSQAVAHYLRQRYPSGGAVFVVGEDGLFQAVQESGFHHSQTDVLAVVVGMDRNLTYEKLAQATLLIRSGAQFVGSNPDRSFPTPAGLVPGAGAILAAIEAATDHQPLIVGKPAPEMYRIAMQRMGVAPENTLVVGDRLETDIIGAQQIGCHSGLVLSGVTTLEAARRWDPPPDWIAKDLTDLLEKI